MHLTERQRKLLNLTFIDYQATSEFLENPLVIDRAEGLYYWDTEGKRYFDAIGGIFVASLGHQHPRLMQAMRDQMEKITFAPPLISTTNVTLDFVEKLGEVAPGNLKFVKPFSGGSEAVESALKFTRQYYKQTGRPNKYKFVSRYYAYHGGTFGGMGASGSGPRKSKFEPQMDGFLKVFPPSFYRDRFSSWEEANRFAAHSVEDVILHEDPHTVAGVLLEPIGNTGGMITPTEEYFQIIREACDRHDVLLIFDEVITGFGKTGEYVRRSDVRGDARHYLHREGNFKRRFPSRGDDSPGRYGGCFPGQARGESALRARAHFCRKSARLRCGSGGSQRNCRKGSLRQSSLERRLPPRPACVLEKVWRRARDSRPRNSSWSRAGARPKKHAAIPGTRARAEESGSRTRDHPADRS